MVLCCKVAINLFINAYLDFLKGDNSLGTVSIATSVTAIGQYAFYGCGLNSSLSVPASVTFIDEVICRCNLFISEVLTVTVRAVFIQFAFAYNSKLNTVVLRTGLTNIANSTFYDCSSLISISIPS